jgi:hypothetical protein
MSERRVVDVAGDVFFVKTLTALSLRMTVFFPKLLAARFSDFRRALRGDFVVYPNCLKVPFFSGGRMALGLFPLARRPLLLTQLERTLTRLPDALRV